MRSALLLILPLTACTTWEPPPGGLSTTSTSGILEAGDESSDDWQLPPRRDDRPPVSPTTATTATTGGPPDPGPPGSTTASDPPPSAIDLGALQIVEVHPDPAGKDGGLESPEFVEILNVGDQPLALAGLEIVARAWPVLSADDLGLEHAELAPGQRLVLRRHASAAELPAATPEGDALQVTFVASGGLRNSDGAVLLRSGEQVGDLVIYGAAQPAPWDIPEAWIGPPAPAPGSGISLCRVGAVDHDDASDFATCPPTPGDPPLDDPGADDSATGESGTTGEALPAELVIVEVLSNPPGPGNTEKHAEFVELLNLGPGSVDLADFTIADSLAADAPGIDPLLYHSGDGGCAPNTCLAPGRRALIVGNLYSGETGAALVLMTDDTTIANAGLGALEPVVLRDGADLPVSTYRAWPDPQAEPNPSVTEMALLRADPSAPDTPEAWSFAAPSPGT